MHPIKFGSHKIKDKFLFKIKAWGGQEEYLKELSARQRDKFLAKAEGAPDYVTRARLTAAKIELEKRYDNFNQEWQYISNLGLDQHCVTALAPNQFRCKLGQSKEQNCYLLNLDQIPTDAKDLFVIREGNTPIAYAKIEDQQLIIHANAPLLIRGGKHLKFDNLVIKSSSDVVYRAGAKVTDTMSVLSKNFICKANISVKTCSICTQHVAQMNRKLKVDRAKILGGKIEITEQGKIEAQTGVILTGPEARNSGKILGKAFIQRTAYNWQETKSALSHTTGLLETQCVNFQNRGLDLASRAYYSVAFADLGGKVISDVATQIDATLLKVTHTLELYLDGLVDIAAKWRSTLEGTLKYTQHFQVEWKKLKADKLTAASCNDKAIAVKIEAVAVHEKQRNFSWRSAWNSTMGGYTLIENAPVFLQAGNHFTLDGTFINNSKKKEHATYLKARKLETRGKHFFRSPITIKAQTQITRSEKMIALESMFSDVGFYHLTSKAHVEAKTYLIKSTREIKLAKKSEVRVQEDLALSAPTVAIANTISAKTLSVEAQKWLHFDLANIRADEQQYIASLITGFAKLYHKKSLSMHSYANFLMMLHHGGPTQINTLLNISANIGLQTGFSAPTQRNLFLVGWTLAVKGLGLAMPHLGMPVSLVAKIAPVVILRLFDAPKMLKVFKAGLEGGGNPDPAMANLYRIACLEQIILFAATSASLFMIAGGLANTFIKHPTLVNAKALSLKLPDFSATQLMDWANVGKEISGSLSQLVSGNNLNALFDSGIDLEMLFSRDIYSLFSVRTGARIAMKNSTTSAFSVSAMHENTAISNEHKGLMAVSLDSGASVIGNSSYEFQKFALLSQPHLFHHRWSIDANEARLLGGGNFTQSSLKIDHGHFNHGIFHFNNSAITGGLIIAEHHANIRLSHSLLNVKGLSVYGRVHGTHQSVIQTDRLFVSGVVAIGNSMLFAVNTSDQGTILIDHSYARMGTVSVEGGQLTITVGSDVAIINLNNSGQVIVAGSRLTTDKTEVNRHGRLVYVDSEAQSRRLHNAGEVGVSGSDLQVEDFEVEEELLVERSRVNANRYKNNGRSQFQSSEIQFEEAENNNQLLVEDSTITAERVSNHGRSVFNHDDIRIKKFDNKGSTTVTDSKYKIQSVNNRGGMQFILSHGQINDVRNYKHSGFSVYGGGLSLGQYRGYHGSMSTFVDAKVKAKSFGIDGQMTGVDSRFRIKKPLYIGEGATLKMTRSEINDFYFDQTGMPTFTATYADEPHFKVRFSREDYTVTLFSKHDMSMAGYFATEIPIKIYARELNIGDVLYVANSLALFAKKDINLFMSQLFARGELMLNADGTIQSEGASIGANFKVSISGKHGVYFRAHVEKFEEKKRSFLGLKQTSKSYEVIHNGEVFSQLNDVSIESQRGAIGLHGTDLRGVYIKLLANKDAVITGTTGHQRETRLIHKFLKAERTQELTEYYRPAQITAGSRISIYSLNGNVFSEGVNYYTPGEIGEIDVQGRRVTFQNPILNHSSNSMTVEPTLAIAGFQIPLSKEQMSLRSFISRDPFVSLGYQYRDARDDSARAVLAAQFGVTAYNFVTQLMQASAAGNIGGSLLQMYGLGNANGIRPSIDVGIKLTYQENHQQTLVPGTMIASSVTINGKEAIEFLNAYSVLAEEESLTAPNIAFKGAELTQTSEQYSLNVYVSLTAAGGMGGGASASYSKTKVVSHVSGIHQAKHLNINANTVDVASATITAETASGNIGHLSLRREKDTADFFSVSAAASSSGSASFSMNQSHTEQTSADTSFTAKNSKDLKIGNMVNVGAKSNLNANHCEDFSIAENDRSQSFSVSGQFAPSQPQADQQVRSIQGHYSSESERRLRDNQGIHDTVSRRQHGGFFVPIFDAAKNSAQSERPSFAEKVLNERDRFSVQKDWTETLSTVNTAFNFSQPPEISETDHRGTEAAWTAGKFLVSEGWNKLSEFAVSGGGGRPAKVLSTLNAGLTLFAMNSIQSQEAGGAAFEEGAKKTLAPLIIAPIISRLGLGPSEYALTFAEILDTLTYDSALVQRELDAADQSLAKGLTNSRGFWARQAEYRLARVHADAAIKMQGAHNIAETSRWIDRQVESGIDTTFKTGIYMVTLPYNRTGLKLIQVLVSMGAVGSD